MQEGTEPLAGGGPERRSVYANRAWSGFRALNFVGQVSGLQVRPVMFHGYNLRESMEREKEYIQEITKWNVVGGHRA
eukprot:6214466-Pleurochrysis_carterae.AAC.1